MEADRQDKNDCLAEVNSVANQAIESERLAGTKKNGVVQSLRNLDDQFYILERSTGGNFPS